MEIFTDACYRAVRARSGGRVMTPPHRKFKKSAHTWYGERREFQAAVHPSRRIDIVQAVAGPLSHHRTVTRPSSSRV
ncbi:transposase [Streptomyces rishiriensis]|nr:transposase [Streptomyces rishiriensis]